MGRLREDSATVAAMVIVAVGLFDGDIDAWEEFVLRHGSDRQRAADLPRIAELRRLAADEPALRALLRAPARPDN